MADKPFISFLKKVLLNPDSANNQAMEQFSTLFRPLVKSKMAEVKKGNLKEIFKLLNKLYTNLYKNPSTLDNYMSEDVRKPISVRFGYNSPEHKLAKQLVRLDYEIKGNLLKSAKEKVFEKNKHTIQTDSKEIIDAIEQNYNSDDPYRKAVALLIASGSRPIELFARSTFTKIVHQGEQIYNTWIHQDNVAKKKGEAFSLKKPLIYVTSDQFLTALNDIRSKIKDPLKDDKLKTTINSKANAAAKSIFKGRDKFTLYTSRKLYGNLSYDLFGRNKTTIHGTNPNLQVWLSLVLGHAEGSVSATHNYSHISLAPDTTTPDELNRKQDVLETKIDHLEERMEGMGINEPPAPSIPKVSVYHERYKNLYPKIMELYETLKDRLGVSPSGLQMEKAAKGTSIPRAYIRQFMKEK